MESSLGLTSLRKVIDVGESYNSFDDLPSLSLNCQGQGDDVSPIGPIVKKPTYLQALLGDNPPKLGGFEHASLIKSTYHPSCKTDDIPSSQFKIPSLVMSSTGGSVVSRRNRSLSMSAVGTNTSTAYSSPLRTRVYTSEAGSPTIEQALLMSENKSLSTDYGYGSLLPEYSISGGDGLYSSFLSGSSVDLNQKVMDDQYCGSYSARPSISDIMGIDIAVAEAVQNLQSLRQKQVAIRSEFGFPNSTPGSQSSHGSGFNSSSVSSSLLSQATLRPANGVQDSYSSCLSQHGTDPQDLERAARLYRSAATHSEASFTWSGQLPHRTSTAAPNSSYSTKIFLGGVPWDISEQALAQAFAEFGEVRVEWPGRDFTSPPKGYLYLVFEEENDVKDLLAKCSQDFNLRDSYYYKISSRRTRAKDKEVQIIPWVLSDSNYVRCQSPRLDPQKTVFVGALHGMMTAQALAVVFNDLFGGVIYAGLDTDKYKYPIGSGRVTFNNQTSFMKAVSAAFIEIKTPRFNKKIQVDPYLEDTLCSVCTMKQGPYFCRDKECFNYYCIRCWDLAHPQGGHRAQHKPLMRNIRGITRARASANSYSNHHDHNNNSSRYRHGQETSRGISEYLAQALLQ